MLYLLKNLLSNYGRIFYQKIFVVLGVLFIVLNSALFVSCKEDLSEDLSRQEIVYSITAEYNEHIQIVLSSAKVNEGDLLTITFVVDSDYSVKTVYINEINCTNMLNNNVITLYSVNEDKTVSVVAVKNNNELPGIK